MPIWFYPSKGERGKKKHANTNNPQVNTQVNKTAVYCSKELQRQSSGGCGSERGSRGSQDLPQTGWAGEASLEQTPEGDREVAVWMGGRSIPREGGFEEVKGASVEVGSVQMVYVRSPGMAAERGL